MEFFEKERNNILGLNNYSCHELKPGLDWYYDEFNIRLNSYTKEEKKIDKYEMTRNLLAIAESGWDFNVRFMSKNNRFAALSFAHIDLSSLIYDALNKLGEMLSIIKDSRNDLYIKKAKDKKELIKEEKLNKDSVNFIKFSNDNKYMLTASVDGSINIFSISKNFELINLDIELKRINAKG